MKKVYKSETTTLNQTADELIIANKELAHQKEEKEKRADELIIANRELVYQNEEKEKRAAELVIANNEKEKRVAELIIANKELAHQKEEKEKRADELITANKELVYQNEEKEKRAEELLIANNELKQFAYIASHELQEPLRTISNYMQVFEEDYLTRLDENAVKYLHQVKNSTRRMSILITSLLEFSRLGLNKELTYVDCGQLIDEVISDLNIKIKSSNAIVEVTEMPKLNLYETEVHQLFQNLILNAIKFQEKGAQPKIQISSEKINEKWKFSISDNGIGISREHFNRVFDIFQRLHNSEENYIGSGIGLAYCKKIVQMHHGEIWVESNNKQGVTFHFTIPKLIV